MNRVMTLVRKMGILGLMAAVANAATPWSGIVSPSRAIDWSQAGLPATFPDGERTANPWTPPNRPACTSAQAGITVPVPAGTAFSSIITAMHNCSMANPTGSILVLGPGTFTNSGANFASAPNVTLRGSGPMSTIVNFNTGSWDFGSFGGTGGGTLAASPAAGATSVTVTGVGGPAPQVGYMGNFNQCNTGYTGAAQPTTGYNSCPNGSAIDNGGIFVCGGDTACDSNGSGSGVGGHTSQWQTVRITSVKDNGGGSYTIGFTPGLYLPNWSTANTAALYWRTGGLVGVGLEDMTISRNATDQQITMNGAYACWIKGVRFVGFSGAEYGIQIGQLSKNILIANNYFFGNIPSTMGTNFFWMLKPWEDSDNLILNNIGEQGGFLEGQGASQGDVIAYNYSKNVSTTYIQATDYQHDNFDSGVAFVLNEGNQMNSIMDNDTWGTGNLNTFFRNWSSCDQEPYTTWSVAPKSGVGIGVDAFHRFDNAVGNVLGGTPHCTSYQSSSDLSIFRIGQLGTDPLAGTSLLRWYNYDSVTGTTRCQASEVPTSLSGNAAPFQNSVPANCSAPASFFMGSVGAAGPSWWSVCTSWTKFPNSCASVTTNPFPSAGPDVIGGNYINGHAYDNPAQLAWKTLPLDTSLQKPYTITGSNWSGGTETLTISGLPSGTQTIGPFQLSGVNAACTAGAAFNANDEIQMTGSSANTISYALAANPNTVCTGTFKFPDVRQFDEAVYGASGSQLPPPNGCDVNNDGLVNVTDVQTEINMALGLATCTNSSGICNVTSVQKVINAALGGACVTP